MAKDTAVVRMMELEVNRLPELQSKQQSWVETLGGTVSVASAGSF